MSSIKKYFGPSTLVAAAFIGPGTLTVCTLSGAQYGYSLIWVLVLATLATIFLQEMTARIGLISRNGLGEAIRSAFTHPILRFLSAALVSVAIIIGNAAYEAGNISGAAMGLQGMFGAWPFWPLVIGALAFSLLWWGKIKILERVLIAMVIVMSCVFVTTALWLKPDFSALAAGLIPRIEGANPLAILALIGTTIVPYNLFLHAASVQEKWKSVHQLGDLRKENTVAIALGGLISIAILMTSATALYGQPVSHFSQMAKQLEPLLGAWSTSFLGIGLFAAGVSSAITAPLAAAYTAKGIFEWPAGASFLKFRFVWMGVLGVGIASSMLSYTPLTVIQIAQVANGILLPIMVFFLIYLCNKKSLLGTHINGLWHNIIAVFILLLSLLISIRSLNHVFSFL